MALAGLVVAFGLAAVAPAVAQDPVASQYDNQVVEVKSASASSGSEDEASGLQKTVVGGLPFTGLDVIALGAVALALTSIGFALRRLSPPAGD